MSHRSNPLSPARNNPWLRPAAILVVVAIGLVGAWQRAAQERLPSPAVETTPVIEPAPLPADDAGPPPEPQATSEQPASGPTRQTIIGQQAIRDQSGRVVFRGDVDVSQTLDRIDRSERLEFPNDGSTFQNRERRLPKQPTGYYREYVHPTPGVGGPGPQRIVTGNGGEIYYTPDHYRTFRRLDKR